MLFLWKLLCCFTFCGYKLIIIHHQLLLCCFETIHHLGGSPFDCVIAYKSSLTSISLVDNTKSEHGQQALCSFRCLKKLSLDLQIPPKTPITVYINSMTLDSNRFEPLRAELHQTRFFARSTLVREEGLLDVRGGNLRWFHCRQTFVRAHPRHLG